MSDFRPVKLFQLFMIPAVVLVCRGADSKASRAVCKWDQYYDPNVDDCGPCFEICDFRKQTRTERQCHDQCSDYLVSRTCGWNEYFDEKERRCANCSELCKQVSGNRTTEECSRKCGKYLDTHPPDNSQSHPLDLRKKPGSRPSSSSSSSSLTWLPAVVTIVVGVIVLTAIFVMYFRYYKHQQNRNYIQAPRNDVPGNNQTGTRSARQPGVDVAIPMMLLQPPLPIQVSSEEVASGDICLQRLMDSEDTQPKTVEMAIAECDPVAPSSAASEFVRQLQQCR